jgi:hypothetical protein
MPWSENERRVWRSPRCSEPSLPTIEPGLAQTKTPGLIIEIDPGDRLDRSLPTVRSAVRPVVNLGGQP